MGHTPTDAEARGALLTGRFPELEEALVRRVAELRQTDPLAPLTVVVGSGAVRTRLGDLLVRGLGAVANVRLVTLSRLAADLVTEQRGAPPVTLAGLARERLLRRLVRERAATGFAFFGPVAERPHFARALAATIADLREARVDPDGAWARAATGTPGAKAADLEALYAAYCLALGDGGFSDAAAVYLAAAEQVPSSGLLGHVVLYGLYDLNQAQEALTRALLEAGADALVPVARDDVAQGAAARAAARAAGLAERKLEPPTAAADRERVAAVWREPGARGDGRLALAGDRTLAVVSVADERAEAREAVRAVLAAAEEGAPLCECAVVVPRGDDVERVAGALDAAGLPVACRLPWRSPPARLLLRLADCLAPPSGRPFARRATVDLLATAPLRAVATVPGEAALWLDEARQAGVVGGLEQWTDRLGRRRRGLERREGEIVSRGRAVEVDALADDADERSEKLAVVRRRLAAARDLEIAVGVLRRACAGLPAQATWDAWAAALGAVVAEVFETPAGEAARDAADGLRALAPLGEEVDVTEAVAVLRELLDGQRVTAGHVGRAGVAVLTPLEMRGLRFHTVVFTGLADGGFPPRGRQDPLLGDAERRRLMEAIGVLLPLAEQRDAEARLLFAFACEAARERLVLVAPRTDAGTGRPRLPSSLLLRLAALVTGRAVGLDEFLTGRPLAPVWRHVGGTQRYADGVVWVDGSERDTAVLLALSTGGRRSAAGAYLADVFGAPAFPDADLPGAGADAGAAERRLAAWRAARGAEAGAWDGLLGADACAALAARRPRDAETHPTRLERYIACPFAYLLRDVLELEAPDEPGDALEMDRREFGTLAHAVLQRAYERVIADGLDRDGALEAVEASWAASCAEAERRGVTGAPLAWEVTREMLRDDLLESVRRDPVFAEPGARPVAVEWRFGEAAGRPVELELGGGRSVRFAGRVDRIDAVAAGARVVDYKTGAGRSEKDRIKDGLCVQLPVYQLAVRRAGGADYGTVTGLYRLVTRRGGLADLPLLVDEAAAAARLRELVAEALALAAAGHFPRTTRGRCEFCDVRYACGVSAWTRARKREHAAFAPVVRLQAPAPDEGGDGA